MTGSGVLTGDDGARGVPVPPGRGGSPSIGAPADALAEALVGLCRLCGAAGEPRATLLEAANVVLGGLPGTHGVCLALGDPEQPIAVLPTGAAVSLLDGWQMQAGEGPGLDAWRTHGPVTSDDLRRDPRWPRLAALVPAEQPAPALAVPISDAAGALGVLACCLNGPAASSLVAGAVTLAGAVAGLVRALDRREHLRTTCAQLEEALRSRAVIDQAKGVVMAERGCTADEAFGHLAQASQHRNVKVRELAAEVVAAAAGSSDARRAEPLGRSGRSRPVGSAPA